MAEPKMVKVEYIGPIRPGVAVYDTDGRPLRADFGEPVEVDSDTAKGLLSQVDSWREPKPGPKPKASGEEGAS